MKADAELEPFARLVEALEPWVEQVVVIGGWAHRLYRLDPRAQKLAYPPLTTLDSDVAVRAKIDAKEENLRERLLGAGFQEEFVGEDRPPATHYRLGAQGGFYAEFLTPLVGSEHGRGGTRKATREVGGISSQQLRYVDILLVSPWKLFRILNPQIGLDLFQSAQERQNCDVALCDWHVVFLLSAEGHRGTWQKCSAHRCGSRCHHSVRQKCPPVCCLLHTAS